MIRTRVPYTVHGLLGTFDAYVRGIENARGDAALSSLIHTGIRIACHWLTEACRPPLHLRYLLLC